MLVASAAGLGVGHTSSAAVITRYPTTSQIIFSQLESIPQIDEFNPFDPLESQIRLRTRIIYDVDVSEIDNAGLTVVEARQSYNYSLAISGRAACIDTDLDGACPLNVPQSLENSFLGVSEGETGVAPPIGGVLPPGGTVAFFENYTGTVPLLASLRAYTFEDVHITEYFYNSIETPAPRFRSYAQFAHIIEFVVDEPPGFGDVDNDGTRDFDDLLDVFNQLGETVAANDPLDVFRDGVIDWKDIELYSGSDSFVQSLTPQELQQFQAIVDSAGLPLLVVTDTGLAADYSGDGVVDSSDYAAWRNRLNTSTPAPYSGADGTGDSQVTADDLAAWLAEFGRRLPPLSPAPTLAVPTPSATVLVLVGLLQCLAVSRRRN